MKNTTITNDAKISKVMNELKLTRSKAIKQVYFLDWLTENDKNLEGLFFDFKVETNDNTTEFMEFCMFMYKDCENNYINKRKHLNTAIN